MISTAVTSDNDPIRRDHDTAKRYVTWRRGATVVGTVLVGWFLSLANYLAVAAVFLEVPYVGVEAVAGNVAACAPLAATACILAATLSPSRRWSHRLARAALVPTSVWAISWMVVLGGA